MIVALFVLLESPISGQHVKHIKFHRSSFCLGRLCFRMTGLTRHIDIKAYKVTQSRFFLVVLAMNKIALQLKET